MWENPRIGKSLAQFRKMQRSPRRLVVINGQYSGPIKALGFILSIVGSLKS